MQWFGQNAAIHGTGIGQTGVIGENLAQGPIRPMKSTFAKNLMDSPSKIDKPEFAGYAVFMKTPSLLLTWCHPLTLLLMLATPGCQQQKVTSTPARETPVITASTIQVEQLSWPTIIRTQGSLYPVEEATLGIKVEGRVVSVHVDLGDVVEEGQPLLTLHQDDFKLRVEQAEAQLSQARSAVGLRPEDPVERLEPVNSPPVKEQRALWDEATANLTRARELLARGAIVQAELDQLASAERVAAARYDSALNSVREKIANIQVQQALLDQAQEALDNTILKAPFSGVVQRRLTTQGNYVKVGDPLVVLVRTDELRYRGSVPERLSQQLQVGQQIELNIESVGEPRVVKVTRISPFVDQQSRALLFEADVENELGALRAGLFAEGRVIVEPDAKAVIVPILAVSQFAGTQKVWRVVEGKIVEQAVLLGDQRLRHIRILEGLNPGDEILVDARQGRSGAIAKPEDSVTETNASDSTAPTVTAQADTENLMGDTTVVDAPVTHPVTADSTADDSPVDSEPVPATTGKHPPLNPTLVGR